MLYSENFQDNQTHNSIDANNTKKTYKVLLRIQTPYVYKVKDEYTGLMYDLWQKVKKDMPDYTFEETYAEISNNSDFIKKVNDENYDLGIGAVAGLYERTKLIAFTQPVLIDKCIIMFKDKHIYLSVILKFFLLYFIPFFVGILLLAFVLGFFLTKNGDNGKGLDFKRTIALTASALFGSKGSLFQNVQLNAKTIFIIIVILMISTFSLQLLQATITNIITEARIKSEINLDNIFNAKLIGVKGSNVPELFETNYHCKMQYFDGDLDQTIQEYLKNTSTLDGVVANGAEALQYSSKYDLTITNQIFSLNEHCWIVNFKTPDLLLPLNQNIRKIIDSGEVNKLCKAYIGWAESYMCLF